MKEVIRSLPFELWPEEDRRAWIAACQPSERLKRGGAAAHLTLITRDDLARRCGYFLDYLSRHGLLSQDKPPAADVTPENVAGYVAELKARVSSVTVYGSIYKLRRASELMASPRDFTWLSELEKDLAFEMRPRSKSDRLVLTGVLIEAGLSLIAETEAATNLSEFDRARQVRNGLMVVLLALCPIRLKNFSALAIGSTFVDIKGQWWIVLAASMTKEKRADERPADDILNPIINRYITVHRPILARGKTSPALWLSSNDGEPMSYDGVERAIKSTTLSTVGVDVSPHLFRTSAASTAAMRCGKNQNLGAALLHHIGWAVANEHYNWASSASAGKSLREVIRTL
jgi:site-specific recombinase XerD